MEKLLLCNADSPLGRCILRQVEVRQQRGCAYSIATRTSKALAGMSDADFHACLQRERPDSVFILGDEASHGTARFATRGLTPESLTQTALESGVARVIRVCFDDRNAAQIRHVPSSTESTLDLARKAPDQSVSCSHSHGFEATNDGLRILVSVTPYQRDGPGYLADLASSLHQASLAQDQQIWFETATDLPVELLSYDDLARAALLALGMETKTFQHYFGAARSVRVSGKRFAAKTLLADLAAATGYRGKIVLKRSAVSGQEALVASSDPELSLSGWAPQSRLDVDFDILSCRMKAAPQRA